MSISLNSVSKFKTRVLPSVTEYIARKGALPSKLCYSLASLITFYKGEVNGKEIALNDDQSVLDFAANSWKQYDGSADSAKAVVNAFLANADFWGQDLTELDGLAELVGNNVVAILEKGIAGTIASA